GRCAGARSAYRRDPRRAWRDPRRRRGVARRRSNLMAIKQGWIGRVFEDFVIGDVYEYPLGRTVLDADNIWFTCLTMNTNPIHFDGEYAKQTEFKRRLVNSCFTLSLVTGQSVTDLTM